MARRSARKGVTEKKQPEATSQEQRAARLAQTRNLKMARSAHAYVRGSTVKFYEWLEASASKVPEGRRYGFAGTALWEISDLWRTPRAGSPFGYAISIRP
ncbi:MAG: DUF2252 family protein [Methylocella sp.]